jgi:hypothetical protein
MYQTWNDLSFTELPKFTKNSGISDSHDIILANLIKIRSTHLFPIFYLFFLVARTTEIKWLIFFGDSRCCIIKSAIAQKSIKGCQNWLFFYIKSCQYSMIYTNCSWNFS